MERGREEKIWEEASGWLGVEPRAIKVRIVRCFGGDGESTMCCTRVADKFVRHVHGILTKEPSLLPVRVDLTYRATRVQGETCWQTGENASCGLARWGPGEWEVGKL